MLKVPYKSWKNIINECFSASSFIEELSRALYGKEIFEIYLQPKAYMRVVDGKSRRNISDDELKAMKRKLLSSQLICVVHSNISFLK